MKVHLNFFVLLLIQIIFVVEHHCFLVSTSSRSNSISSLPKTKIAFLYHRHQQKTYVPFPTSYIQRFKAQPNLLEESEGKKDSSQTLLLQEGNQIGTQNCAPQDEYTTSNNRMKLLHERLQACNVTKYCFVNDHDSTDQYSPIVSSSSSSSTISTLERTAYAETKYLNAIHVKTLVWKGVYLQSKGKVRSINDKGSSNDIDNESKENNNNNNFNEDIINRPKDGTQFNKPFYFVTALRIQDKVDMKSLRALVKREWPKQRKSGGVLILQMAEQSIAEELTGFQSGSMPPGWHSVPMSLFIDDYIIHDANLSFPPLPPATSSICNDETNGMNNYEDSSSFKNDRFSQIIMSVGSGAADFSLHVSLQDLFNSSTYHQQSANTNSNNETPGLDIIIRKYRNNVREGYHAGRQICSFSRASVEAKDAKRKSNNYDGSFANTMDEESITATASMNGITEAMNESKFSNTASYIRPERDHKEILKALTRKAFNVAARKKGKANEVRRMIERMGDKFPEYMTVDQPDGNNRFGGEMNKNALHYAAWKGDLETISLLINAARERDDMDMDIVNVISTGEGNYGKTAIFYSITQCRDDAVLLLLSHGASLLIVNNKGQTPCSLAFNKLKKETCEFMFQMEEHQLKAGGKFRDYRETHSDGQRYGDLDPRFIRPGDVNVDKDILKELGIEANKLSDLSNLDVNAVSLPRSVRITTALMRQIKWHHKEDFGKTIIKPTPKVEELVESSNELGNKKIDVAAVKAQQVKAESKTKQVEYRTVNTIAKLMDGTELDMTTLNTLYLRDVLSSNNGGTQTTYELIDDEAGILAFQFAVDESISNLSDDENDSAVVNNSWGLDCEWRPSHVSGEESPVAVLQVSSGSRAFIIDVQTILQPSNGYGDIDLTPNEILLSESLAKLFSNPNVKILGFGIGQDLTKLAASFPQVPCFRDFSSVIDLQALSRQVYPGTPKQYMSSLQKAVAILLRRRLDKTEQCSEWDSRPLTASQLEYASLDATILPKLLEKMIHDNGVVEKENGFFFKKHSYLRTSYRFQILSDEGNTAYRVPMGSIKTALKIKFARQIWPTFKQSPQLPEVIPLHEAAQMTATRAIQNKEKKVIKDKRTKRNPISVSILTGDLSNLPTPGITLGYTKESVIERIVRRQVIEALPEDAYLQYNRRGGIIELGNCFLLFVNFGVGRIHHKYRNEFLQGGKQVTFTINQGRYDDGELFQSLLTPEDEAMYYKKPVLFFIRASTRDKFMFCGNVKYAQHEEKDGDLIDLVLDLKNFDALVASSMESDDDDTITYMKIVERQDLSADA